MAIEEGPFVATINGRSIMATNRGGSSALVKLAVASGGTVHQVQNAPVSNALVILRDPIERWVSGSAMAELLSQPESNFPTPGDWSSNMFKRPFHTFYVHTNCVLVRLENPNLDNLLKDYCGIDLPPWDSQANVSTDPIMAALKESYLQEYQSDPAPVNTFYQVDLDRWQLAS